MEISEIIKSSGMNPLQIMEFIQNITPKIPMAIDFVRNFMSEKEREFSIDVKTEIFIHSFLKTDGGELLLAGFVLKEKDGETIVDRKVYEINVIEKINYWKDNLPF